jgi:transposase-like protein
MVLDHQDEHGSQWAAIQSIASKIGCSGETPRNWVRRTERDDGVRLGATSAEKEELARLRREVRELRQANVILRKGETLSAIGPRTMSSAYFAMAELDRPLKR